MAGNSRIEDFDELTRARMDIIGLKITVQALTVYLAHTRSKNKVNQELREIVDAIFKAVDNIDFSNPATAEIWRSEVKSSIHNTFDSLLAVSK